MAVFLFAAENWDNWFCLLWRGVIYLFIFFVRSILGLASSLWRGKHIPCTCNLLRGHQLKTCEPRSAPASVPSPCGPGNRKGGKREAWRWAASGPLAWSHNAWQMQILERGDYRWKKGCKEQQPGKDKEAATRQDSGQQDSGEHEELQQGAECCWLVRRFRYGKDGCRCLDQREISTNAINRRSENCFCTLKVVYLAKL